MNAAELKNATAGLTDDNDSCRFHKMCQVMENMTKAGLVAVYDELLQMRFPGSISTSKSTMRRSKFELMRWVSHELELAGR